MQYITQVMNMKIFQEADIYIEFHYRGPPERSNVLAVLCVRRTASIIMPGLVLMPSTILCIVMVRGYL
ncbi:unnamed protein product [Staurois parvus]|uniref:Uncharacterized protein n=1 Tax=Staurois parvus TaxID=386267 RepID=A0ABN9CUY3_9NEOB|nr:unnamed protein product [Staurois parvus]